MKMKAKIRSKVGIYIGDPCYVQGEKTMTEPVAEKDCL